MNEAVIICCALAVCFSVIALICGLVAVAMVAGFTRSTHSIQFKSLAVGDDRDEIKDPLAQLLGEDDEIGENPFRRKRRPEETKVIDTENEQKDFMEDVTDSNNF